MSQSLKGICLMLGAGLLLSSCTAPNWFNFDSDNGQRLAPGEKVAMHFFTREPNYDSGIALQAGSHYQLSITLLNNWIDSYIDHNELNEPLDERGFANSVMPQPWLGWTRRSRDHRWFELMLVQPNCKRDSLKGISNLTVDEASGSYNFVASCDGKLTLFVNDSYGFYGNNVGYANIALTRVN